MTPDAAATAAAVVLALVHVLGGRLRLQAVPRSAVLSAASGVSVAYVFVHLLPEVAEIGASLEGSGAVGAVERWEWVLALAGLVVFHGLELWLRRTQDDDGTRRDRDGWLHLAVYALYTSLVGYLLLEQAEVADSSLVLFTIAMALHLLVNDHGLREEHGRLYERRGRWLLVGAVVLGNLVSLVVRLPEEQLAPPLAFLAGAIVLTVLKEELPRDRRSRIGPFVGGAVLYAALLLAV